MPIIGTDHSKWDWCGTDPVTQGYYYIPIAYDVAYRNGSRYTFLKACDGKWDTPFYSEAIRDARAAGLLACPYVWLYARSHTAPEVQADFWYSRLKDEPLVVVDFEGYLDYYPSYDDLYCAIERLRANGFAGKIMIYTGHWYWLAHGSTADYWKQFPVWLARYYTEPPQDTPPWDTWTFWQYTNAGDPATYGITNGKASVDLNRFEGTMEELQVLFGAEVSPPQGEKMYEVTPIAGKTYVNVRADHSAASADIGDLRAGEKARGSELWVNGTTDKWLHVTEVNGLPKDGWIAVLSGGNAFTVLTEVREVEVSVKDGEFVGAGIIELRAPA